MKLEVKNVSKSFEEKQVLDQVSIHLEEGEIVCLLGASGGGKTTLFNIISGLMSPDRGAVYMDGQEITGQPGRVSYMLQKDMLLPYKTVLDNVALPLMIKKQSGADRARLPLWKKQEARKEAASYFEEFGLDGYEKKYPSEMSGGMRQRAALLRTYLFSDEVALLDEPFSALDAITKNAMHQWYLSVMEKIHLSTLFITHDMDEAILLSDRIYILAGVPGQIVEEIRIEQPKPRNRDFLLTEDFLQYKKRIRACLQE